MATEQPSPVAPPVTVVRVACSGSRSLGGTEAAVTRRASSLFDDLVAAHGQTDRTNGESLRLQLLSGLADGADQCVAAAFLAGAGASGAREHIAVLPFDEATYRRASPVQNLAAFDDLIARSSLVIELDGRWLPDGEDPQVTAFARHCRARAYRAQARLMLQRADLLLAVLDPDAEGRAGGTGETVRHALELGLPVLLLAFGTSRPEPTLHHLSTVADFEALGPWSGAPAAIAPGAQAKTLQDLVAKEIAPPPPPVEPLPPQAFFEGLWARFESRFASAPAIAAQGRPSTPSTEKDSPFHGLRQHVSQVNRRYTGRYRSGFLINFSFAALATLLAASSLGLMVADRHDWPWLAGLLFLALLKFALVSVIWFVTRASHKQRWNEKAVNARYLAENLRLLLWLPALGKLRAPRRSGEHHTDEKLEAHTADALLRAAVRAAPPDTGLAELQPGPPRRCTVHARAAILALSEHWTQGQIGYHAGNAIRLGDLHEVLEHRVEKLNLVVIGCVLADIVALGAAIWLHWNCPWLTVTKVLLVVAAASLPAAVAALNGLREQSEARRLAGRSRQLQIALEALKGETDRALGRIDAASATPENPGAWTLEALALAERCSTLVAEDVAEWTVLYNKQILET